ncbi:Uncharacterised protein [Mycobacteroides abscessus subsp. abscessus]|nr:Uncharacterised protein [Mycobacteroides abscessus subsp. abscessus]
MRAAIKAGVCNGPSNRNASHILPISVTPSIWHSNHMDSCDEDSGKRSGRSAATRSGRPSCGAASISSDSSRSSSSSSISNSSRK